MTEDWDDTRTPQFKSERGTGQAGGAGGAVDQWNCRAISKCVGGEET